MQKLRIYEVNYTPMLVISDARDNMVYVHHYDDPAQAMIDVADWAEGGDAGSRENSDHEHADIGEFEDYLIGNLLADFRDIPFPDETFNLVVMDPPHLTHAGEGSWLREKYGVLGPDWKKDLRKGFQECMRVLKTYGTLIFKWNEYDVPVGELIRALGQKPLFDIRRKDKTHWLVFMKMPGEDDYADIHSFILFSGR